MDYRDPKDALSKPRPSELHQLHFMVIQLYRMLSSAAGRTYPTAPCSARCEIAEYLSGNPWG